MIFDVCVDRYVLALFAQPFANDFAIDGAPSTAVEVGYVGNR